VSNRKIAVIVGILFFVQMITFMIGSALIQSFLDGNASRITLTLGVGLEMCSGLAVVAIGLLMYRVLKVANKKLALGYPVFRIIEFAVSTICGIYLLNKLQVVPNYQLLIYIPTALGGLILAYLLFVSRLVPRPIAAIGIIGYALLFLGVLVDLPSSVDMNHMPGLLFLIPGSLFEFILFPIWSIAKGFKMPQRGKPFQEILKAGL
jgi:hypothetical protein